MLPFILRELCKWGVLVLLLKTQQWLLNLVWCFTSAREEYPHLGWICLGNGMRNGAEGTTGECHQWRQAGMIFGDKPACKLQWIKRMSWTFCTSWTSCFGCPLSRWMTWEGFFWLIKVVVSNQIPPTTSQDVPCCPSHSFIPSSPFMCPSSPLKATRQGSEDHHGHSMVSSIKPKRYCLALKLSGQPLYAETEGLFR